MNDREAEEDPFDTGDQEGEKHHGHDMDEAEKNQKKYDDEKKPESEEQFLIEIVKQRLRMYSFGKGTAPCSGDDQGQELSNAPHAASAANAADDKRSDLLLKKRNIIQNEAGACEELPMTELLTKAAPVETVRSFEDELPGAYRVGGPSGPVHLEVGHDDGPTDQSWREAEDRLVLEDDPTTPASTPEDTPVLTPLVAGFTVQKDANGISGSHDDNFARSGNHDASDASSGIHDDSHAIITLEEGNDGGSEKADQLVMGTPVRDAWDGRRITFLCAGLLIVIITLAMILAVTFESAPTHLSSHTSEEIETSTLHRIKEEGVLTCGCQHNPHEFEFDTALCRAMAAAILGDSAKVVVQDNAGESGFIIFLPGVYDVTPGGVTHTMDREVIGLGTGLSFSTPYLYVGSRFVGNPFFVQCADNNFNHVGDCSGLKVCAWTNTLISNILHQRLPPRSIILKDEPSGVRAGLHDGSCNVAPFEGISATETYAREAGYQGDYAAGAHLFAAGPLSLVTGGDTEFSDFVTSVVESLFVAEKHNITQSTADLMPQTGLFGDGYSNMFRNAIGAEGNFGEIYDRTLGVVMARDAVNMIHDGTTALHHSHPFGSITKERGDLPLGPTLSRILQRGILHCGVRFVRQGFATKSVEKNETEYAGMDIDYCRALSSSLFKGRTDQIVFVALDDSKDGYMKLARGEVDVIAGATWNLQNDIREPATGIGFKFTKPYFYSGSFDGDNDNFCLATMQDDRDWASFVYWVVEAIVYAEENGLDSKTSNGMPLVFVFGSELKRCFRNAILAVGNYGSIYERNLQAHIPRGGRNLLNDQHGPQHYLLPGIID